MRTSISHPPGFGPRFLQVNRIGYLAREKVSANQDGCIAGITSRGVFVKLADNWMLFLSSERFRGPLTLNIATTGGYFGNISSGMPVQVSQSQLIIPSLDLNISFETARVWQAPLPLLLPITAEDRMNKLYSVCQRIIQKKSVAGLAPLIPLLIHSTDQRPQNLNLLQLNILSNFEKVDSSDRIDLMDLVNRILGAGSGLTPSGDDFVIGFLLALNRWGDILITRSGPWRLNGPIVNAAYMKTTTLSANLIECAAQGQADERLIWTLDWLMSSLSPVLNPIDELQKWGHSSGIDAFVGFMYALKLSGVAVVVE